jgi:DNA polymerase-3 subunit delta
VAIDLRELAPVYLLVSEEPLLVERAVTAIRDAAVPEAARAFNYDVLEAKAAGAAGIMGAARTVPMMARRRMVVVRDISALAASDLAELSAYLEDPNPTTVLVGLAGKIDRRVKFFAAAKKHGYLHDLLLPRNLASWLREEVGRRGARMTPAAQARLLEVVGKDLARLALSIDQLALYAGDAPVTAEHVDELCARARERTVFELTDAIGAGDGDRAGRALAALFDQRESAIGVVVMLARHMRQLGWVLEGSRKRWPRSEVAQRVGAPPFVVDKLEEQARRFTPAAIASALSRLSQVDRALKGEAQMTRALGRDLAERVLLEQVVGELLRGAAG